MINKPAEDRGSAKYTHQHIRRKSRSRRSALVFFILLAFGAVAFFVGSHLRQILPHRHKYRKIDCASITLESPGEGVTTLVQTSDGRSVVISSDFGTDSANALLLLLQADRFHDVSALILTNTVPGSAYGVSHLATVGLQIKEIILPFEVTGRESNRSQSENDLLTATTQYGIKVQSWDACQTALSASLPLATIQLLAPRSRDRQEDSTAVRLTYGNGSLVDFSGLSKEQIASLTGAPIGGTARILLINGGSHYLSKEILVAVQPDVVVLSGSTAHPPEQETLDDVTAADATVISLAATPEAVLNLPASSDDPVILP